MKKTKAKRLVDVDNALDKFEPVEPNHEFFVDFKEVRGEFEDREIYKMLNVSYKDGLCIYNQKANQLNKTLVFLAGMRGIGKTSELAKYAQNLHHSNCFFVVTCNIDKELDMNDVQYMDILIFQVEKLIEKANEKDLKLSESALNRLESWFQDRILEINTSLKAEGKAELEFKSDKTFWGKLLGITASLKAGISGTKERAEKIRTTFKNRFSDFANTFNEFVAQVGHTLRENHIAQDVLFIIDGLEKTLAVETRRKLIMEESNRIRQIKTNMIFTLPVELINEQLKIKMFSELITFPCVKLKDKNNQPIAKAYEKFEEFVFKRIDESLFDSKETVRKAIEFCGGVPKDLLRILETANWFADDNDTPKITMANVEKAIQRLSNEMSRFLTEAEIEELRKIRQNFIAKKPSLFNDILKELLEKLIVLEYNNGTDQRVHPLVEVSETYKEYVLNESN